MPPFDRSYGTIEVVHVREDEVQHRRQRSSRPSICCCICTVLAVLLITFLATLYSLAKSLGGVAPREAPDYSGQSFAVGFDLSSDYGATAVSFSNGTTIDLGAARGVSEYIETIRKLSLESSSHPTPPYYDLGHEWSDWPRQLYRRSRKAVGLPASRDVAALATMLGPLKATTLKTVGDFKFVFVTVPHLPALYNEDLVDACEYVGLQLLTLPWWVCRSGDSAQWPITHINTAMAGNDIGMCHEFMNATECLKELNCTYSGVSMNTFSVLYTMGSLVAHVSPMCNAMHFYAASGVVDLELAQQMEGGTLEEYWTHLRDLLREALGSYLDRGHELDLVILHGSSEGYDHEFMDLLRQEVTQSQKSFTMPKIVKEAPIFAAARGAAEFGRRCMLTGLDCIPDLRPRGPGWFTGCALCDEDDLTCDGRYYRHEP